MELENSVSDQTDSLSNDDDFAELIRREIIKNLYRNEQEKKQHLVLKKYIPAFAEEIKCMMYCHGDVRDPLPESVLFIGTILRDQMNMLLVQATEVSPKQKQLTHENILPLLLKNKPKLKRLLHYLKMKDMKDVFFKSNKKKGEGEASSEKMSLSTSSRISRIVDFPQYGKRIRICLASLQKLDKSFDPVALMENSEDPTTAKRLKRRYLMTHSMSEYEYLQYHRKIQASFYPKGGGNYFKSWLLLDNVTHLYPNELALEIINFLAYETLAEIMDLSLRLKYSSPVNPKSEKTKEYNTNVEKIDKNSKLKSTDKDGVPYSKIDDETLEERVNNEQQMETVDESIMPTHSYQSFQTDLNDIKSISKDFGDEFKEGVVKTALTPDNIKETMNFISGINKHQYDVSWKKAKRHSLLCIQDIHSIFIQKLS